MAPSAGYSILVLLIVLSGCALGSSTKTWQYEQLVKEPIVVSVADKDANLDTQQFKINIPEGSLAGAVSIVTPGSVPKISSNVMPLGAPLEISARDKPVRLDHLMTISVKVESGEIPKDVNPGDIYAVFYDGSKWEYFKPDKVDFQAGVVTFTTDHLTLFGTAKIPLEEYVKRRAHSETLAKVTQEKTDKVIDKLMEAAIDKTLKDGLGLDPESYKSKIMGSLMKKDEYKDMYDAIGEKDPAKFYEKMNELVGEALVENLPESQLTDAFKKFGDEKGEDYMKNLGEYVKAGSQAAGALAEGNYRQAVRYVGETFAKKFLAIQAARSVVEVMDYEIGLWKNDKIEAAYQAYKNGAEGNAFGYSVDKGDFEALWSQMRAIDERLEIEAVEKEKQIRLEGNAPLPSDREIQNIKDKVKADLKRMFEARAREDQEIEKREAELDKLFDAYKDADMFIDGLYRYSSSKYDLETRFDSLLSIRDRILRDTDGNPKGRKVTNTLIIMLTRALLSGTMEEGQKEYAELLKKEFGVGLEKAPVAAPLTRAPKAKGGHPVIASLTCSTSTASIVVSGGTPPYYSIWFASAGREQIIYQGTDTSITFTRSQLRDNGEGYWMFFTVKDAAGKDAVWLDEVGMPKTEFTCGTMYDGRMITAPSKFPYRSP